MRKLSYTLLFASGLVFGQFFEKDKVYTKQDTLKGSNTPFRNFWDVKKYDLSVESLILNRKASKGIIRSALRSLRMLPIRCFRSIYSSL
ncbi:hypothetical protein [Chryseobacterium sp.]|uniref:hypothetical protein n=1 Tax=Chryseobacterium sp. TaxID=1871047 RepID=UPI00345BC453